MTEEKPSTAEIFVAFLKLGLTAFGGVAMIPYIRELCVVKKKWIDAGTFSQGLALCQTLPGATAVNVAGYAGLKTQGIRGMLAAAAGFTLPAFGMLLVFSAVYQKTHTIPAVLSLFTGLQVIVVAIIANALLTFGRGSLRGLNDLFIAAASAAVLLLKVNPFVVILAAAAAALLLYPPSESSPSGRGWSEAFDIQKPLFLLGGFSLFHLALVLLDRSLFDLAFAMTKIELLAFGGGYTALSLMFHEVVEAHQWLDSRTFMDGIALGQITPGPILISAAFIGYLLKGLAGALAGTIGIFGPGLVMVAAAEPFYRRLSSSPLFLRAVRGIGASFTGLLAFVLIRFASAVDWGAVTLALTGAAFLALVKKVDVLYVVLIGGVLSIGLF